jgi:hypothetical protein
MHTPTSEQVTNEPTLGASQRLDWRFLFSDPALETVGFAGPLNGSLYASLRAFSRTVVPVTAPIAMSGQARFDVLVLSPASPSLLRSSRSLLAPGGWLYAEVRRSMASSPRAAVRGARFWARQAAAAGLTELAVHWHWPTFEACTRLVPIDESAPLSFLLSRGEETTLARLKAAAGLLATRSGALGWVAPCISVIGRAPRAAR